MTERDAFEIRFGAAVHGYVGRVSSDLDPAEFAHRIATSEPRRRRLAGAVGWARVAIPRRTWVLLVLAGLVTALVAGMLVVSSQPVRKLPAVVPPIGRLAVCPPGSTPDTPGPVGQARPRWEPAMAFDRRAGKLVGVRLSRIVDTETWTFDVCTNTWTQMHPDREPPRNEGARLVYDADSDATLMVSSESGNVWAYDLQADTWTEKGVAPTNATLLTYDPVSGLAVAEVGFDPTELRNYDVETDTWTPIHQANGAEGGPVAYDASVDRIVAVGAEAWLFDLRTGRWSRSDAVAPHVLDWLTLPNIAYDEAAERTVIGGNVRLAAYDATADRWETVEFPAPDYPDPDAWHGVSIVDDPVNARLVVFPDTWGSWRTGTDPGVAAVDLVTREWTVLLAPSQAQPAPSSE
jgi:hypothetical protein